MEIGSKSSGAAAAAAVAAVQSKLYDSFAVDDWEAIFDVLDRFKDVRGSLTSVAEVIGITPGGLSKRHKQRRVGGSEAGRKPLLGAAEAELAAYVKSCAAQATPVSVQVLNAKAKAIAVIVGVDPDHVGTPEWRRGFYERFGISPRISQPLELTRALAVNSPAMNWFYDGAEVITHGVHPANIFTFDESALLSKIAGVAVLAETGAKFVFCQKSQSNSRVSLVFCAAANGDVMPPSFVFQGVRRKEAFTAAWPECQSIMTPSGGMEKDALSLWALRFIGFATSPARRALYPGRIVLLFDNHSSHMTPDLTLLFAEHGITTFTFLPHTTHVLSPLDTCVFRALKAKLNAVGASEKLNKYSIVAACKRVMTASGSTEPSLKANVISGFATTGIYPFKRDCVKPEYYKASERLIMLKEATAAAAAINSGEEPPPAEPKYPTGAARDAALAELLAPVPIEALNALATKLHKRKTGSCVSTTSVAYVKKLMEELDEKDKTYHTTKKALGAAKAGKKRRRDDDDDSSDDEEDAADVAVPPRAPSARTRKRSARAAEADDDYADDDE